MLLSRKSSVWILPLSSARSEQGKLSQSILRVQQTPASAPLSAKVPRRNESGPTKEGATHLHTCRTQFIVSHQGLWVCILQDTGTCGKQSFYHAAKFYHERWRQSRGRKSMLLMVWRVMESKTATDSFINQAASTVGTSQKFQTAVWNIFFLIQENSLFKYILLRSPASLPPTANHKICEE